MTATTSPGPLDEAESALSDDELQIAMLHYDIGEVGEMHHNPAKKRAVPSRPGVEEIARAGSKKCPAKFKNFWMRRSKSCMPRACSAQTPFVDKDRLL